MSTARSAGVVGTQRTPLVVGGTTKTGYGSGGGSVNDGKIQRTSHHVSSHHHIPTQREHEGDWDAEHCLRTRVFMVLDHMYYSKAAWAIGAFMCTITLVSCAAFVLGTAKGFMYEPATCSHPTCRPGPGSSCTRVVCFPEPLPWLSVVEWVTVVFFIMDFLLRVSTVNAVPERLIYWDGHKCHEAHIQTVHHSGLYKTLDYLMHYNQLIDLLVITPFIASLFINKDDIDVDTLRLFRISTVLRVLKLGKYSEGAGLLIRTLRNSGPALVLLILVTAVLTLVLGTFVYFFESGDFKVTKEHPEGAFYRKNLDGQEEPSPFMSIPICAYWVAVTATTVGYGDLSPTSAWGQAMAVLISYAGIVGIALPVAVVVKEFNLEYDRAREEAEEEARYAVETHGGHVESEVEEHAVRALEMRLFVKEQLRMAAPAWQQLWEEFALQYLQDKLDEHDKAKLPPHKQL